MKSKGVSEIASHDVGEMVMERLADVDEVAFVRFSSVYRDYQNITMFIEELKNLQKGPLREKNDSEAPFEE